MNSFSSQTNSENPDLASAARQLLLEQRREWPMLERGCASLSTVQTRPIDINGTEILLQFNPGRMISAAAKVDPKSIAERRCFLCESNVPAEQRGLAFGDDYLILCNPFPIFPEHFTIPHRQHRPQQIADSLPAMLDLAHDLADRYIVFYNGPRCGASAPDHLHFQAGSKDFLPLVRQYDRLKSGFTVLSETSTLRSLASNNYPVRFMAFESSDPEAIRRGFDLAYQCLQRLTASHEEPLLNLLVGYEFPVWRALLFPRCKHRPGCYFAGGDAKILLSPATVEMAGVCALPVERDFHRLTREDLMNVYEEVTLSQEMFQDLCRQVQSLK